MDYYRKRIAQRFLAVSLTLTEFEKAADTALDQNPANPVRREYFLETLVGIKSTDDLQKQLSLEEWQIIDEEGITHYQLSVARKYIFSGFEFSPIRMKTLIVGDFNPPPDLLVKAGIDIRSALRAEKDLGYASGYRDGEMKGWDAAYAEIEAMAEYKERCLVLQPHVDAESLKAKEESLKEREEELDRRSEILESKLRSIESRETTIRMKEAVYNGVREEFAYHRWQRILNQFMKRPARWKDHVALKSHERQTRKERNVRRNWEGGLFTRALKNLR